MTRVLFSAVAAIATFAMASAAGAADMQLKAAPLAPAPAPSWTGFYIGGTVGGGVAQLPVYDKDDWNDPGNWLSDKSGGLIGGVHVGYNMQVGSGVFGLEGEFSWAGFKASNTAFNCTGCDQFSATSKLDMFGSIRARAGLALDRTLLYVTAGPAFGHIAGSWNEQSCLDCTLPLGTIEYQASHDAWHWGIAVGAGMEFALTQNWLLRGEFLYLDFLEGTSTLVPQNGVTCSSCSNFRFGFSSQAEIARVGMSYKLGNSMY